MTRAQRSAPARLVSRAGSCHGLTCGRVQDADLEYSRKKSRCPGERPSCSYCDRLGQPCDYADEQDAGNGPTGRRMVNSQFPHLTDVRLPGSTHWLIPSQEDRISNLEGKLDQVLERLLPRSPVTASQQRPSPVRTPTPRHHAASEPSQTRSDRRDSFRTSIGGDIDIPQTEAHEAARLYLIWAHCQPVRLFDKSNFLQTIESRDSQVLLAIRALCLRFPPGALTASGKQRIRALARQSRTLVMERVGDGRVNLATIQALCLLSMSDLADGQTVRAGAELALANNLADSVPADFTLGDAQEFADCKETILLLLNLHGSILPGSNLEGPAMIKWCPSPAPQLSREKDLAACIGQMSEAWHMARVYAASHVARDAPPPWHPLSDYSVITQKVFDIECSMPIKYRFAASHFLEKSPDELQGNRNYWGPWLFVQFVYGGVLCLLNHPYLLSLRLRSFRQTLPQTFIHQSFKLISRQSSWITYFVNLLEERQFLVSDPTLAHCVAIVATIHLQHSFVPETELRERSLAGFQTSLRFLRSMGTMWPHVSTMVGVPVEPIRHPSTNYVKQADNLEALKESVIEMPTAGTRSSERSQRPRSIDASLLRNILIQERAGQPDAARDRSIFGDNLVSAATAPDSDYENGAVDYGLVGSAGIEGHSRNKAKKTPLYPPEYVSPSHISPSHISPSQMMGAAAALGTSLGSSVPGNVTREADGARDWCATDQYGGNLVMENDLEGMSFQADDFGRAIDGWMNMQLG